MDQNRDLARMIADLLSTPPPPRQEPNFLGLLSSLRSSPPRPNENFLGELEWLNRKDRSPATGATDAGQPSLRGLFGGIGSAGAKPDALQSLLDGLARGNALAPPPITATPVKTRNTFYSFHYADIFRVNHVRNSGKIRATDKGRNLVPRDRSLWEKVKLTNPQNLRRVIDAGVRDTTVTCVLAGEHTWSREWVRYEIARSLHRGNGLLTVHIDQCECPREGFGRPGPNPLDYLAVGWDRRVYEWIHGGWYVFDKIRQPLLRFPRWLAMPAEGHVRPLSEGAAAYDWHRDEGRRYLVRWTHAAARAAGR
jgi:hypothetical protein